jgi:dTDP-4-dehydrorhamnose 3,5-epimerase
MVESLEKTSIDGCFVFKSSCHQDHRGSFFKMYSRDLLKNLGFEIPIAEVFFSESNKNVIRGMHFQTPPHAHIKLVTCLSGRVLDVVLDLRISSPTFKKAISFELSPQSEQVLIIPRGCAHGFYSYENKTILCYAVETGHSKTHDQGVHWNSFGFPWPSSNPLVSERDSQFLTLTEYRSPFAQEGIKSHL